MTTASLRHTSVKSISGVSIPDTQLAREINEFIRETETELLFNHSSHVYYFGAIAGKQCSPEFNRELLYAGAMFHDIGLMLGYSSSSDPFEVDGANAASGFLKARSRISTLCGRQSLFTRPPASLSTCTPRLRPDDFKAKPHSCCSAGFLGVG